MKTIGDAHANVIPKSTRDHVVMPMGKPQKDEKPNEGKGEKENER